MDFRIELGLPDEIPREATEPPKLDDELDDIRTILTGICESLGELRGARFSVVVGEPILVTVECDLAIVMEQLLDTLRGLQGNGRANLDLYEQGPEWLISFEISGSQILIERNDMLPGRRPSFRTSVPRETVLGPLRQLAKQFVEAANLRSPSYSRHPWFIEWAAALLEAAELLK